MVMEFLETCNLLPSGKEVLLKNCLHRELKFIKNLVHYDVMFANKKKKNKYSRRSQTIIFSCTFSYNNNEFFTISKYITS